MAHGFLHRESSLRTPAGQMAHGPRCPSKIQSKIHCPGQNPICVISLPPEAGEARKCKLQLKNVAGNQKMWLSYIYLIWVARKMLFYNYVFLNAPDFNLHFRRQTCPPYIFLGANHKNVSLQFEGRRSSLWRHLINSTKNQQIPGGMESPWIWSNQGFVFGRAPKNVTCYDLLRSAC